MDDAFDVNVLFIPIFKGANVAMAETMKRKFRSFSQQDLWEHVLFCKNEMKEVSSALKLNDDDIPYFFLLNKNGEIIYRTSGNFSDAKFDALDEKIE